MRYKRGVTAVVVLALVLALGACATVAPGEDPFVVKTEQVLMASTPIYDTAMGWCTANAAKLSAPTLVIVNKVRVSFPPAYRALDSALQVYKAGKAGPEALQAKLDEVSNLLTQIITLVAAAGGPDLSKQAVVFDRARPPNVVFARWRHPIGAPPVLMASHRGGVR